MNNIMRIFFLWMICMVSAGPMVAESNIGLFNSEYPLRAFPGGGAKIENPAAEYFTMIIPAGTGWPQAKIPISLAADGKFTALQFKATLSKPAPNGWTVNLMSAGQAVAGGYLHTVFPGKDGFYRIDLSAVQSGIKLDAIRIAFKNPADALTAEFSEFQLESNPYAGLSNLAQGAHVEFSISPDYPYCTDSGDQSDLTDGKINSTDKIWMNKGTVGFRSATAPEITIDLGEPRDIGTVRFHTGAGMFGVYWPTAINVFAACDREKWGFAGEMVAPNREKLPEYNTGLFNLWLDLPLNVNARYLKFVINCDGMFSFCDEIEVYSPAPGTPCRQIDELAIFRAENGDIARQAACYRGVMRDVALVRANAARFGVETAIEGQKYTVDFSRYLRQSDTVAPANGAQRALLEENWKILRAAGFSGIVCWNADYLEPFNLFMLPPDKNSTARLDLRVLGHERRIAAVNFTNACAEATTLALPIHRGIAYLEARSIDSIGNFLNANLLVPPAGGQLEIPSGATAQLLLVFNADDFAVGRNQFMLDFGSAKVSGEVIRGKTSLPEKFTTTLGGFDYIDNLPSVYKGIDADCFPAMKQIMDTYQINVPWGSQAVVPRVDEKNFAADDALAKAPDFRAFDAWFGRFPGQAGYAVFWHVPDRFAGVERKTEPEKFARRLQNFFAAWVRYCLDCGIAPEKIILHMVDEAGNEESKSRFQTLAAALNAAAPKDKRFQVYFNPRIPIEDARTYEEADILVAAFSCAPRELEHYLNLANRRRDGRFGFYSCTGNARELDAYSYYMLPILAGMAINNFSGFDFWSLDSGFPANLDEYGWSKALYTVLYRDGKQIYPSKQLEAMAEARTIYEYFRLLKQRAPDDPRLECIRQGISKAVAGLGARPMNWASPRDRSIPARWRESLWMALEQDAKP